MSSLDKGITASTITSSSYTQTHIFLFITSLFVSDHCMQLLGHYILKESFKNVKPSLGNKYLTGSTSINATILTNLREICVSLLVCIIYLFLILSALHNNLTNYD